MLALAIWSIGLVAAGCSDVTIAQTPEREGDDPGECSDGADNDGDGVFDCDDPDCGGAPECTPNAPPGAPQISITPSEPTTEDLLRCVIDVASLDPDGDTVEYEYRWTLDGGDAGVVGSNVDPGQTGRDEVWMCTVLPTDEHGEPGAAASTSALIVNAPPTRPEIAITPGSPVVTDDLFCEVVTWSTDPDGDDVDYLLRWVRNSGETGYTDSGVPSQATEVGDLWACLVTPTDGIDEGPSAEDSVDVHVDALPHVAAGSDHSCSMQLDSTWACWGDDSSGEVSGGTTASIWKLAAGSDFTCTIRFSDTGIECWGDQSHQQHLVPLMSAIDLGVGATHGCAVTSSGELVSWGSAISWPVVAPAMLAVEVTAGDDYCCGRDDQGGVQCWGFPPAGDPSGLFVQIDGGADHFCGVTDGGEIACFGDDAWGQVGGAPEGGAFEHVTAGWRHTCAIEAGTGFVSCWGDDTSGQVTPPTGAFQHVDAGRNHTCGKRPNGTVECWGCQGNDQGQCSPPL